jgi:hypothetical protein
LINIRRAAAIETAIVAFLFTFSAVVCLGAMRAFRAAHVQPQFYQANFEPAVMMACGYGFVTTTVEGTPASMRAFLHLERDDFACSDFPPAPSLVPVSWNGTWYYLYAATAMVWRIAGISWTALDALAAILGAVTTAALYGLLRLAGGRWAAAAVAMLLTISPGNLAYLTSLRDYSKAPFVLASVFVLALLIVRPMARVWTVGLAALFGAIVGVGYGFRNDLLIMAPFGAAVVLVLLPGGWKQQLPRNVAAVLALLAAFLCAGWPALRGLKTGGCQFHYALLGLTRPMITELGLAGASYSFGDHFLDTFVDLKVGDYAQRTQGSAAPGLCSPEYDAVSGKLFTQLATTFPADLALHAYGAVLMITYAGPVIPEIMSYVQPFPDSAAMRRAYRGLNLVSRSLSGLGPLVTMLAVSVAWMWSPRLGIALTVFVLFLCGYTAIEFEARHWFHLRFIPWWSALFVASAMLQRGNAAWPREAFLRGGVGIAGTLATLVCVLWLLRLAQVRSVGSLIDRYAAARTGPLEVVRHGASADVDWRSVDYGNQPGHRSSDLVVLTLDPARCGPSSPVSVRVRYDADLPSHDMSTTIGVVVASHSSAPPRLFVPVFAEGLEDRTYLRFAGFEAEGRAAGCLGEIARIADRSALPIWVEMQIPASAQYQTLRLPRILR